MNALTKLVAKYVDNDNPTDAMEEVGSQNYTLMRSFPEGVPAGVMMSAAIEAQTRVSKMIAGMVIDLATPVQGWSNEVAGQQEALTFAMIDLLAADSLNMVLKATMPESEEDDGE